MGGRGGRGAQTRAKGMSHQPPSWQSQVILEPGCQAVVWGLSAQALQSVLMAPEATVTSDYAVPPLGCQTPCPLPQVPSSIQDGTSSASLPGPEHWEPWTRSPIPLSLLTPSHRQPNDTPPNPRLPPATCPPWPSTGTRRCS